MRLALLSDLHANPAAMQACMARAHDLGATQFALLGDLVGYGPDPSAIVDMAREMEHGGAWVLRGNHDAMAAAPPTEIHTVADEGAQWTHDQLDAEQRAYLAALPLQLVHPPCFLVHASADAPAAWRYVNNPTVARDSLAHATRLEGVRYVMGGHVHMQALYYQGRGSTLMLFEPTPGKPIPLPAHRHWLATVGSVGQPRDGNPAAAFALLDTDAKHITFYRVPYDVGATISLARRKGMSPETIRRLEKAR